MIMYELKNDFVKAFKEREINLIPQDQLFYESISTEGKILESDKEFNYSLDSLIFNDGKDCYGDLFSYQKDLESKEKVLHSFYAKELFPNVYNIYFNDKKLYSLIPMEYYQFNGKKYEMDNIIRITELLNDYYTFIKMVNNHNLHVLKIPDTLDMFINNFRKECNPILNIGISELKDFYQFMSKESRPNLNNLTGIRQEIIKYGLYQIKYEQEMQEINASAQILRKIKK